MELEIDILAIRIHLSVLGVEKHGKDFFEGDEPEGLHEEPTGLGLERAKTL